MENVTSNKTDYANFEVNLTFVEYAVIAVNTLIFIVSFFANILAIITLIHCRRLWSPINAFLLNLSISDFLLGLFCIPFTLSGNIFKQFIFGYYLCKMVPFLQVGVSSWTLAAISLERFAVICYPLRFRKRITILQAYISIAIIWLLNLCLMSPTLILSQLIPMKYEVRHRNVLFSAHKLNISEFKF
ncbi:neuropeptide receptor A9-like protein [Leptotrombidium deliense]|uniref:Neuropeptide receptor A9-like protein n=1 Tax=Leptotrombidium deliense TaxID=299467 RepID=A0A443SKC5_9ACAR|nr:neuropeptide receptor A9-like protein [Leptotrombidium deliense]